MMWPVLRLVAIVALAIGAWYLTNRRRAKAPTLDSVTPPAFSPGSAESSTVVDLASRAAASADKAGAAVAEKVQDAAATAQKTVGDASQNVQDASQGMTDRAQQAGDAVTSGVKAPLNGVSRDVAAGEEAKKDTIPSVRETTQAEMADINEQVNRLGGEASQTPTASVASGGAEAATLGTGVLDGTAAETVAGSDLADQTTEERVAAMGQSAEAPAKSDPLGDALTAAENASTPATDQTPSPAAATGIPASTEESKPATAPGGPNSIAPVGQRPRPIAGEGTTTVDGGTVNPLSPVSDGPTSTGVAEPLPAGITAGEPGTGGPAGSSQAPSVPDSVETRTTGMDRPPQIDHTKDILTRTSGAFVGNKSTRVFHPATASKLPGKSNRIYFETEEEALAAGFRPAEHEGLETPGS